MTSNLGSDQIKDYSLTTTHRNCYGEVIKVTKQFKEDIIRPILKNQFKRDEFLGRINEMVYFLPFSERELKQLAEWEMQIWAKRALIGKNVVLTWDQSVIKVIVDGYNIYEGARSIKNKVENEIISEVALRDDEIKPGVCVHISFDVSSDSDCVSVSETQIEPKIKVEIRETEDNTQKRTKNSFKRFKNFFGFN